MPFTISAAREKMKALLLKQLREHSMGRKILGVDVDPGDRCFKEYEQMMRVWRSNPRWTTVDELAKFLSDDDQERAQILAFLVFFNLHAMPYEIRKREENGEVE